PLPCPGPPCHTLDPLPHPGPPAMPWTPAMPWALLSHPGTPCNALDPLPHPGPHGQKCRSPHFLYSPLRSDLLSPKSLC
ncbi:hypothetical protein P7K49_001985, partial [Saguinus oedipus]